MFDAKTGRASIDHLFKYLWPHMAGVGQRLGDAIRNQGAILAIMNANTTHDARMSGLVKLSGVGPTIASGLLWSFFSAECVPFDRHTMGYCIYDWKILKDPQITNGTYAAKCKLVVSALSKHDPQFPAIVDLIRYAGDHATMEADPL